MQSLMKELKDILQKDTIINLVPLVFQKKRGEINKQKLYPMVFTLKIY